MKHMSRIKIWIRVDDMGDGSSSASLFKTEAAAREGYDADGFELPDEDGNSYSDVPAEFDYDIFDTEGCEVVD